MRPPVALAGGGGGAERGGSSGGEESEGSIRSIEVGGRRKEYF